MLLAHTHPLLVDTLDTDNLDYVGGRLNRQDVRDMYDDIDLAEIMGGATTKSVDASSSLFQADKAEAQAFADAVDNAPKNKWNC